MRPKNRSLLLAIIGGMMAAGYLDSAGVVDLSYGFPKNGPEEGAFMALTGAGGGYLILSAFRGLRKLVKRTPN